jgi:hypothetical protein
MAEADRPAIVEINIDGRNRGVGVYGNLVPRLEAGPRDPHIVVVEDPLIVLGRGRIGVLRAQSGEARINRGIRAFV